MSTMQACCPPVLSTHRPWTARILDSLWTLRLPSWRRLAAGQPVPSGAADVPFEGLVGGAQALGENTLRDIGAPDWALDQARRRHEQTQLLRAYDRGVW